MPWIDRLRSPGESPAWRFGWLVAALLLLTPLVAGQQKNLAVYAPQMYYQVSIIDRAGAEYVGLVDLLEPIGRVESRLDKKKWRLRFAGTGNTVEAEFQDGSRRAKVRAELDLSGNFILQGDRGYVPIASLPNLLPRLLESTVDLHGPAHRLFLGATAVKLGLEMRHAPNHLVANFPTPVSPQIASDGAHLRIVFARDPVIPSGNDNLTFTDAPFASANISESNGTTVLNIVGTEPLQAQVSDGGKTLTIAAVTQASASPSTPATGATQNPAAEAAPAATTATAEPPKPKPGGRAYFAVLDAGHGGDERGAQLTESLNEKDVTLTFAAKLRHELEARGISVYNLRGGDATLTSDQRATAANGSRAAIYISVHAATLGTGVRVFTGMIPPANSSRRAFLPWDTAQAPFVSNSAAIASAIVEECIKHKLPAKALAAPVRPLNNVAAAAIAVEIAPKGDTVESITDAKYQQEIASAIAAGIAASRGKLESQ